jgi:hypothetical protein
MDMRKLLVLGVFVAMATPAMADIPIAIPDFSVTSGTPYVHVEPGVAAGDTVYGLNFVADWTAGGGNPWSSELEVLVTPPVGDPFDWDPIGGAGNADPFHFDATVDAAWPGGVGSGGDWTFSFDTSYGGSTANLANVTMTLLTTEPVIPSLEDYLDGTLSGPMDSVAGDTTGASDDMTGGTGDPFGSGSWTGGDHVYELIWGGGDMFIDLLFVDDLGDLDLFLYDNPTPASALASSLSVTDNEHVEVLGAAAGTYYVRIDGWLGGENAYDLQVTPEPGSLALLALGGLALVRRRR